MCHHGVSIMFQNTNMLLPLSELDEAIEEMMYRAGTEWVCRQCGRSAVRRIDIGRATVNFAAYSMQTAHFF